MKIVINKCYGGFGLSRKACHLYASKKGFTLFEYDVVYVNSVNIYYKAINDEQSKSMYAVYSLTDCGDEAEKIDRWSYYDLERDDPVLVEVVKELGDEANGSFSDLRIVDIPDDVEWEIDDYDGMESIHEVHETWG